MSERARTQAQAAPAPAGRPPETARRPGPAAPARRPGPSPAEALALQRSAGNRAAARVLARWTAHPDKDKKGVLMDDAMAAEYIRFNPPLSK